MSHDSATTDRSPTADPPDSVLLTRITHEDWSSFEILVARYATELRNVAWFVVRDAELAEELAHRTFITLWEKRETLEIHDSVSGYLCRMARNLALRELRSTERRTHRESQAHADLSLRHSINEGETIIDAEDLAAVVNTVLDTLQPQVREVFLLRRIEDKPYEEIAELLGISVVSARSQMSRAVRALADALKDWR